MIEFTKKKRLKKVGQDDIDLMLQLKKRGKKNEEIAALVGVSTQTVSHVIGKNEMSYIESVEHIKLYEAYLQEKRQKKEERKQRLQREQGQLEIEAEIMPVEIPGDCYTKEYILMKIGDAINALYALRVAIVGRADERDEHE